MMTLAESSSFFDRTPIRDVSTSRVLFYGQVDPYDDAKRDSSTAYRRTLSVKPGTKIPSTRCVNILGYTWIVGSSEVDGMLDAHREKYVLHPAHEQVKVSRLSGYLAATQASLQWGDIEWVKEGKQTESTSTPVPIYNVYLPLGADVREHDILWTADRALIVQAVRPQPSGMLAASSELLAETVSSAIVTTRTYNPATGTYSAGTGAAVSCLKVRWQALFVYGSQSDAKYQEGDCNLVFPSGTSITTSTKVSAYGRDWTILSVETIGGAVVAHGRAK